MTLAELRRRLATATGALEALNEEIGDDQPTDQQRSAWDAAIAEVRTARSALDEHLDELEARDGGDEGEGDGDEGDGDEGDGDEGDGDGEARAAAAAREARGRRAALANSQSRRASGGRTRRHSDAHLLSANPMTVGPEVMRSAVMRRMDNLLTEHDSRTQATFERIVRSFARGVAARNDVHGYQARSWLQGLLVRSTDEYASGWAKLVSGSPTVMLTPEEARAVAVGTATSGGYLVPTHLDPTIILTNDGAYDDVRDLVQQAGGVKVMLPGTGKTWNGITSAGVTASWDAELAAVSDDTPEFDTDGVDIVGARAWVEASFQSLVNITGLESDLLECFTDAKQRLEADAHCNGAGGTAPTGIVTELAAITACRVVTGTAGSIATEDINNTFKGVPKRWRSRGSWLTSRLYADAVEALGTAVGYEYTGSIAGEGLTKLKGKSVTISDDFPETQTTDTLDPMFIFGDWKSYIIVDRPGSMRVEFVPNVMDPSTGRPVSKRGWLAWWETGAGLMVPQGMRMMVDKTST